MYSTHYGQGHRLKAHELLNAEFEQLLDGVPVIDRCHAEVVTTARTSIPGVGSTTRVERVEQEVGPEEPDIAVRIHRPRRVDGPLGCGYTTVGDMSWAAATWMTTSSRVGDRSWESSVGTVEESCDEDIEYAARLNQVDVPTDLHVYPGAPHGYQMFVDSAAARLSRRDCDEWLGRILKSRPLDLSSALKERHA